MDFNLFMNSLINRIFPPSIVDLIFNRFKCEFI